MWKITVDGDLDKKMARFRSNADIVRRYRVAVTDLAQSADPTRVGRRKRGSLRQLYSYDLTKSFRLLYSVDRRGMEIHLVDLDDHKNLYGRD